MESHITAETRRRISAGTLAQMASICMILGCAFRLLQLLAGSLIQHWSGWQAVNRVGNEIAIAFIYLAAPILGVLACIRLLRHHRSSDEARHPCLLRPTAWCFNWAATLFALTGSVAVLIVRTIEGHISLPASAELPANMLITVSPLLAVALGVISLRLLARGRWSAEGRALATFAIVLGLVAGVGPWIMEAMDFVRK